MGCDKWRRSAFKGGVVCLSTTASEQITLFSLPPRCFARIFNSFPINFPIRHTGTPFRLPLHAFSHSSLIPFLATLTRLSSYINSTSLPLDVPPASAHSSPPCPLLTSPTPTSLRRRPTRPTTASTTSPRSSRTWPPLLRTAQTMPRTVSSTEVAAAATLSVARHRRAPVHQRRSPFHSGISRAKKR